LGGGCSFLSEKKFQLNLESVCFYKFLEEGKKDQLGVRERKENRMRIL
jgi:hypothetical protein